MTTVIDCTNFWSPSGGGVRRYHLEKIAAYENDTDFRLVFIMHDATTWTEAISPSVVIEHLAVRKINPAIDYRILLRCGPLVPLFRKYRPDIVEIGSPYIMPSLVYRALQKAACATTRRIGFWHADYPITYGQQLSQKVHPLLARIVVPMAWYHARHNYNSMHGVFCSSKRVLKRMVEHGINNVRYLPLGVDTELFHPHRRDDNFRAIILGNRADCGKIILFPHRFCTEKGVHVVLQAYHNIAAQTTTPPALVFAGQGTKLPLVKNAVEKYPGLVHYLGFIEDKKEMATLHASCDLGLALSKWETFGLSILESMASGQAQIAADSGAAADHLEASGAGFSIDTSNSRVLADTILTILDSPLLPSFQLRARQYAEQFSWQHCFQRQKKLYQSVSWQK